LPPKRKKRRRRRTKRELAEAKERRAARELAAPGSGVTKDDRKLVYAFYGRRCLACGKSRGRIVLDHVKALFEGGRHDPDNLQVLCKRCNLNKGLQTIDYRPWPWPSEWSNSPDKSADEE
jgi:5-methylcytosine-specific restriction endonuclease McrA